MLKIVIQRLFENGARPLLIALVVNVLLHLPFINHPPESVHVWRQCNTLAIARNFHEEGMNIMEPKVDNRFDKSGITGANFPAYEWGIAAIYTVTGEQFWVHHVYTTLLFFVGIWGLFTLLYYLFGSYIIANTGAIALLFFPDLFYFQWNALPDIMALSAMIWGFYYFIRWFDSYKVHQPSLLLFFSAACILSLAGLVKLYFLLCGFAIAGILLYNYQELRSFKVWCYLFIFAVIAVGIPIAWYIYAIELIKRSGLTDFGLEVRSETNIHNIIEILTQNITSDLPELILNFANTGLLLAGVYYFFKEKAYRRYYFLPALCLFIGILIYHVAELKQMRYHSYYMIPYYPFLAIMVAYGGYKLWTNGYMYAVVILLVANPVLASIRIIKPRWISEEKYVKPELHNETTRQQLITAVPDNALCIVGGDESKCIYYYFLHKKGFGFSNWEELIQKDSSGTIVIQDYIQRGATFMYLYTEDSANVERKISPYIEKRITTVGNFHVYQLKQ